MNTFVVNPLLTFFRKNIDGIEKNCMQLYAYDDIYKLLNNSISLVMSHLRKGEKYTEEDLKGKIDYVLGAEHVDELFSFLKEEELIVLASKDPLKRYCQKLWID